MRALNLVLGMLLVFLSCNEGGRELPIGKPIVISELDSILFERIDSLNSASNENNKIGVPPLGYYSGMNFIIDKTSNIYFHDTWLPCWSPEFEEEVPFIDLKCEDLIVLSYRDISGFVDSLCSARETDRWKLFFIASATDTVNMKSYTVLNDQIDLERKIARMPLRMISDEEREVLNQIKN